MNLKKALSIMEEAMEKMEEIPSGDIPDIDLYMDQVTTFMENKFRDAARNPEEDKIMTKTMINNYAKNNLLPPPVKKKYSKDHMMLLILIYYYKGLLSISDIETLIRPIKEHFGDTDSTPGLEQIYTTLMGDHAEREGKLRREVEELVRQAGKTFTDAPVKERENLQLLSLISSLSMDIYMKKRMIGRLLDEVETDDHKNQKSAKK